MLTSKIESWTFYNTTGNRVDAHEVRRLTIDPPTPETILLTSVLWTFKTYEDGKIVNVQRVKRLFCPNRNCDAPIKVNDSNPGVTDVCKHCKTKIII